MQIMSGITLLRGEELKMQLKPHMFSFFHLYLTFFLLLIWSYVIYDFFDSDKFSDFPFYDSIETLVQDSEVLAGAFIWSFGLLQFYLLVFWSFDLLIFWSFGLLAFGLKIFGLSVF